MSNRKVLQIVVDGEQKDLLELLLRITGTKLSALARRLLLEWAAATVNMPGAMRNGVCGVSTCGNKPADHFSTAARAFICASCAAAAEAHPEHKSVVVPATDALQPAINIDKLREAVQRESERLRAESEGLGAQGTSSLLRQMRDIAAELLAREGAEGERSFEDVLERFG